MSAWKKNFFFQIALRLYVYVDYDYIQGVEKDISVAFEVQVDFDVVLVV